MKEYLDERGLFAVTSIDTPHILIYSNLFDVNSEIVARIPAEVLVEGDEAIQRFLDKELAKSTTP